MGERGSELARMRYAPERVARATVDVYRCLLSEAGHRSVAESLQPAGQD
jgi:hypothetical protein